MKIKILGNVQDGGVPHLGSQLEIDKKARQDPRKQKYVSSMLLTEDDSNGAAKYLIDATPDIRMQVSQEYLDGVFIPHADIGHTLGLVFFGQEGIDSKGVNVYCNKGVEEFLMKNDPFRYLVDRQNIEIETMGHKDKQKVQGAEVKTHLYDHHLVGHNTTGYEIIGEEKTVFYLSDITEFNGDIMTRIEEADIAIIDGTFWSEDEIDRIEEVPHPPIQQSMEEMKDFDTDIYFTHLNHTNPVLREDSKERQELEEAGFNVAEQGTTWDI